APVFACQLEHVLRQVDRQNLELCRTLFHGPAPRCRWSSLDTTVAQTTPRRGASPSNYESGCLSGELRHPNRASAIAPQTMAESAILNAGQWCSPTYQSMKSTT